MNADSTLAASWSLSAGSRVTWTFAPGSAALKRAICWLTHFRYGVPGVEVVRMPPSHSWSVAPLAAVVVAAPDGEAALEEEPDELPHAASANVATTRRHAP